LAQVTPQNIVQLVAGILCVALIGILILRRKAKKKHQEDEF
jgi:LPXTG-motif cell wall-anchored protein